MWDGYGIEIKRQYRGEGEVIFSAGRGGFRGEVEIYCDTSRLKKIGKDLISLIDDMFNKNQNKLSYSFGSPLSSPPDYLTLRIDVRSVHVSMTAKEQFGDTKAECSFSMPTEPWGIHRFGELLIEFSDEKYCLLRWSTYAKNNDLIEWGNIYR